VTGRAVGSGRARQATATGITALAVLMGAYAIRIILRKK
jgi:hypothetical protein